MSTRSLVKRFVPPVIADMVAGRPILPHSRFTWAGVYPDRRSVPDGGGTYDTDVRIAEFIDRTQAALSLVADGKKPCFGFHEPLGVLAASVSRNRNQLRVLDVGGGVGLAFVQLLSTFRGDARIGYHVVDLENMCLAGRKLFANESRIQFYTFLPPLHSQIDIVYASSILPYVDDYAGLLRQLAAFSADHILFTQLAAGNFPTYATQQLNLSGQLLPYWFLNIQELVQIVEAGGYSCVYEQQSGPEYDQSNFPGQYRLGRMRSLLFSRKE